jgi:predicted nucleic acid-binding protein
VGDVANLTLSVPDDLLRRARLRAAREGTSVNSVLRARLAQYVDDDAEVGDACVGPVPRRSAGSPRSLAGGSAHVAARRSATPTGGWGHPVTAFADTNVVAYALDDAEPGKQQVARTVLGTNPRPRTSPQVLRELYVVARSRLGLSGEEAGSAILALVPTVGVVEDAALVVRAVAAAHRWQISLWDALIVEAARRAGATTLLSEDFQHGMDFDGVVVQNPFVSLW